jgi:hypothetical protein
VELVVVTVVLVIVIELVTAARVGTVVVVAMVKKDVVLPMIYYAQGSSLSLERA